MKDKATNLAVKEPEKIETHNREVLDNAPFFIEAEKMFELFSEITRETAHKAFEFFKDRGGDFGREIDDWFKAEREVLRFVPVEITESDGTVNVTAHVAGFKPEEVEISVKDNTLIIGGKTEERTLKKDENVVYSDFRSDRFFRQLTLPTPVDANKAKADLKDGMLQISLPKTIALPEPKRIAVTAAT